MTGVSFQPNLEELEKIEHRYVTDNQTHFALEIATKRGWWRVYSCQIGVSRSRAIVKIGSIVLLILSVACVAASFFVRW